MLIPELKVIAPFVIKEGRTTPLETPKVPELEVICGIDPKLLVLPAIKVPPVILVVPE